VKRAARIFLALAAIAALFAAYAFLIEPRRLVVRRDSIAIVGWPANLPPIRIAVISDIHAGSPFIDDAKLAHLVDLANAQHPDLTLILGDSVIQGVVGGHFMPPEHAAKILGGLRARYGVFGVLGNHDGWLDSDRVERAYESNGIPTLVNETRTITIAGGSVTLAGLADYMTGKPDVSIIDGAPAPVIVMTHNPDIFPRVSAHAALTLAGHTHGGQVDLPLLGRPVIPSRFGGRYAFGHIVENGRHLYVTSGVGTSIIPVRFRVVPEVLMLEVRSADRAPRP
jgi:predicted MPP superfamily phosphohydrolase